MLLRELIRKGVVPIKNGQRQKRREKGEGEKLGEREEYEQKLNHQPHLKILQETFMRWKKGIANNLS